MTAPRVRIGDMLVAAGMLTPEKLGEALAAQKQEGKRLGTLLVERGFVSEEKLVQILGSQLSVPWVSLYHVDFSRQLLNYVPRELAEKYCLVPVYVRTVRHEGDILFVAMDDPTNEDAIAAVAAAAGLPARPMVAAPSDIRNAIRVYYGGGEPVPRVAPTPPPQAKPAAPPRRATPAATAPATPPASAVKQEVVVVARVAEKGPEKSGTKQESGGGKTKKPRMIKIALLDGTMIELPAPGQKSGGAEPAAEPAGEEHALTANDLVAALRAKATGADVTDVLGNATWESMFAALLSVLLKKHLVADWEFVEEWKKHRG